MRKAGLALILSTSVLACGGHAATSTAVVSSGQKIDLHAIASRAPVTVVTFFSAHCPCQAAHDARLRDLHAAYADRGVQFVAIDVESGAGEARADQEKDKRHYPFPLLADPGGATADELGAEYATYTVILDREGRVHYRGGIDSDRTHLTADAHPYLREALDDMLAGREVRTKEGKVLGCSLQR